MEKRLYGLVALNTTKENLARYFESTANEVIAKLLEDFENHLNLTEEQIAVFSSLSDEQRKAIHDVARMYIMKAAHHAVNNVLKMVFRFAMN